jgi:membrane associated rhomboid family serine protease
MGMLMRYGYRSFELGVRRWTKGVKWLIIINCVVFLLMLVGYRLVRDFGLTPTLVKKGYIWQLFTYMFLHGGLFHLFFNMFVLWMFGPPIERQWGTRQFVKYYFYTGIGAGLFTFVLSINSTIPTIGASGAIFGILVAYALMFPDSIIYLWFLFPIKAKYLVIIFGILELIASVNYTPDGIGHFAHLGGMVVGYLYLKSDWRTASFFRFFRGIRHRRKLRILNKRREETEKLMSQVDQILDRINQVGYENLSKAEKKVLEKASHILSQEKDNT